MITTTTKNTQPGLERSFQHDKGNPTANLILNGERVKAFFLRSGT